MNSKEKKARPFFSIKRLLSMQQTGIMNAMQVLGGYSPFPAAIVFEMTHRCNMRCEMCEQAADRAAYNRSGGGDLGMDKLKLMLDNIDCWRLFKPRIHLTGGEPLIHAEFREFTRYMNDNGFHWSLTTNGYYLEEYAEDIVLNGCRQLHVSIDGLEGIHDGIRGCEGSFERSLKGIELVRTARDSYVMKTPKITISTVINSKNYRNLEGMIRLASESGCDSLNFAYENTSRLQARPEAAAAIDYDFLEKEVRRIKNEKWPVYITFLPDIKPVDIRNFYLDREYGFGNNCVFPWLMLRVMPNADARICNAAPPARNLLENDLRSIWNSGPFKSFRKNILRSGIPADSFFCNRCCKRQYYRYVGQNKKK